MTKGILDFHLHFPRIFQLVYSKWTYGGSGANFGISAEDMSFQLGILNWLVIPIAIFLIIKFWKKQKNLSLFLFLVLSSLFSALFLATSKSRFLWEFIPLMKYIQFPWRFLGWTTFFSAFLAGAIFLTSKKEWQRIFLLITCYVLLITLNLKYFKPKSHFFIDERSYLTNNRIVAGTTSVTDEYFPKWVKSKPKEKAKKLIEIKNGNPKIKNLKTNFFKTEFDYSAKTDSEIFVNYIYYPGFKAVINQKELEIRYNNERGLINFTLPKGQGKIKVVFQETNLRKTTNIISLITFLLISSIILKKF